MPPMGSVRRGGNRGFFLYLGLNVIVSAVTILGCPILWGRRNAPEPTPFPTATFDAASVLASAIPTATETLVPTATPYVYRVQPDNSLFGIALQLGVSLTDLMELNDLNETSVLDVGQVLLVPTPGGPGGPPATAAGPLATASPPPVAEAPLVVIVGVSGVGDLAEEAVQLLNSGGVAAMAGWTLEDGEGEVYVFPEFILRSRGGECAHASRAGYGHRPLLGTRPTPVAPRQDDHLARRRRDDQVDLHHPARLMKPRHALLLALLLVLLSGCRAAAWRDYHHSEPVEYYFSYPTSTGLGGAPPLFIALLGEDRSPLDCIELFQQFAEDRGFALLCPALGGEAELADPLQAESDLADDPNRPVPAVRFRGQVLSGRIRRGWRIRPRIRAEVPRVGEWHLGHVGRQLPRDARGHGCPAGPDPGGRIRCGTTGRGANDRSGLACPRDPGAPGYGRRRRPQAQSSVRPSGVRSDRPVQFMKMGSVLAILAEEHIATAMAAGAFTNLPGRGAPLRWDDDVAVPDEWRLAFHVLRSNGFAPAWIEMGKELRRDIARAHELLRQIGHDDPGRARLKSEFADLAPELNRRIARFNLQAPGPHWHLPFIIGRRAPSPQRRAFLRPAHHSPLNDSALRPPGARPPCLRSGGGFWATRVARPTGV